MFQPTGPTPDGGGSEPGRSARATTLPAALLLACLAFAAGRLSGPDAAAVTAAAVPAHAWATLLVQAGADPRELIPLPSPDGADGLAMEECLLLYQDGELYRFEPGPGGGPAPGGGPQELIPLEPFRPPPGGPPRQPVPANPPGTLRTETIPGAPVLLAAR
jgi:hypothetical protein